MDVLKEKVEKEKPDFIICAGDFTVFGDRIEKWMKEISKLGRVFLVHGNHEDEREVAHLCEHYDNVEFMHGKIREFKEVVLLGWGGGGFSQKDLEFEAWAKENNSLLRSFGNKKKLFIVHAPFHNTALDEIDRDHVGCKSFSRFVKDYPVEFGFCGHIHENAGKDDNVGRCLVFNPGPKGKIIIF